jgi:extracellular elastinolytic metalloproteinase
MKTFGAGISHPLRKRGASLKESSEAFIASHLGVTRSSAVFHSGFAGDVASHAYAKQVIVSIALSPTCAIQISTLQNNIPVANAVANVAFNTDDKVVAFGSSFVKPSTPLLPRILVE